MNQPKEREILIQFRCPNEIKSELIRLAKIDGRNLSNYIRYLCITHVERILAEEKLNIEEKLT